MTPIPKASEIVRGPTGTQEAVIHAASPSPEAKTCRVCRGPKWWTSNAAPSAIGLLWQRLRRAQLP